MKKNILFFAISILLASTSSLGAPTVTGNVISWPDDGWYQVQNAETYEEICAGVRSCEVDPGVYIVINHTTGVRFESIVVDSEGQQSVITVNGNVISWPDDGWYQVQNAETYEEVCAGVDSCEVDSGIYIVINHTTADRYTVTVVSSGSPTNPDLIDDVVTVTDSVISWPDDGWYQVQNAATYEEICDGGSSCAVL
ncbi:MAG: hypothetical protein AB8B63_13150, partial [Granulosicoccus sp.]